MAIQGCYHHVLCSRNFTVVRLSWQFRWISHQTLFVILTNCFKVWFHWIVNGYFSRSQHVGHHRRLKAAFPVSRICGTVVIDSISFWLNCWQLVFKTNKSEMSGHQRWDIIINTVNLFVSQNLLVAHALKISISTSGTNSATICLFTISFQLRSYSPFLFCFLYKQIL